MNQKKIATHNPLMKKHKKGHPCWIAIYTIIFTDLFQIITLPFLAE